MHVRLGFTPEIDRAVIDFVRHSLGKFGVLGKICLARHDIHCKPGDAQLLVAAGIELRELGDRRHLPEEAQPVEASLVDSSSRPRELRRPSDLALDLLDELADLGSSRFRLLTLDTDEGGLVLLVRKPNFGKPIGDQRHADDGQKQGDVFPKQAAAQRGRHVLLHGRHSGVDWEHANGGAVGHSKHLRAALQGAALTHQTSSPFAVRS